MESNKVTGLTQKKIKLIGTLVVGVVAILNLGPTLIDGIILIIAGLFVAAIIYLLKHLR